MAHLNEQLQHQTKQMPFVCLVISFRLVVLLVFQHIIIHGLVFTHCRVSQAGHFHLAASRASFRARQTGAESKVKPPRGTDFRRFLFLVLLLGVDRFSPVSLCLPPDLLSRLSGPYSCQESGNGGASSLFREATATPTHNHNNMICCQLSAYTQHNIFQTC